MNDPGLVSRGQAAGELRPQAQDVLLGERPLPQHHVQRLPRHALHDEEVDAVRAAVVEESRHVGVAESQQRLGLLAESRARRFVPQAALGQHLQRHVAAQPLVPREVHLPHAARADLLDDAIGGERPPYHRHLPR